MGPTEALATFALRLDGGSLPPDVVHAARRAILDCLGVALAGSREPAGRIVAAQAVSQGGPSECTLWGCGGRVGAQGAALANGTAAHALDYDDTNHSIRGHPSVPLLPAVVAMGERLGASGAEVMAAFVAGFEVECKLGKFSGQDSYDRGFHCTSTMGVVGATAAVGRLMGLEVPAMRCALGLAVAQAGGVRQSFGTMAKPFHVGRAAQSAILAAELAARGFTASQEVIEGVAGFWDLFGGPAERDGDELGRALGNPFDLVTPGVNFKAYPCCAFTHPSIDAALEVAAGLPAGALEEILVEVPYTAPMVLIHHRPTTGLAAKFSLEYCVARALLDGAVGLRHFTEESVNQPEVQALLRRVDYRVPEEWQKRAGCQPAREARVRVRLKDGSTRSAHIVVARGTAANPLSDEALEAKFLECATLALGAAGAREALELVRVFERLEDVRQLTEKLVAAEG